MYSQAFIAALFVATAAGAPLAPKARQLSGTGTDPLSAISSLLGGLGGGSEPTGIPSLPTSLLGGLGGGSIPTGLPSLPTDGANALPTDLPIPTGFPSGLPGLPSGLPSGLSGLPSGLPIPTALPTSLAGLPSGLPSGLGDDSTTESNVPSYSGSLSEGLGSSGSSVDEEDLTGSETSKRQLGGTSTSSSSSSLTSLLSGLGGGTSTSSGSGALSSLLSGLGGGSSTTSSSSSLSSLLSGLGGGSSTTSSSSSISSLLSGLTGSDSTGSTTSSTSSLIGGSDTENGLDNACKSVTVIFARGTTESGNMGSIVGPGLTTDVSSALNNDVNVQGVDYAADAAGIASEATGPGAGSEAMIADVTKALAKCPDTQIILSGYSQGAMLVHNTMGALNSTAAAAVKAAVTFGDPFVGEAITNLANADWKSFCATDDPVCEAGAAASPASGGTTSASTLSHLGYGSDTGTAATFIKGKVSI